MNKECRNLNHDQILVLELTECPRDGLASCADQFPDLLVAQRQLDSRALFRPFARGGKLQQELCGALLHGVGKTNGSQLFAGGVVLCPPTAGLRSGRPRDALPESSRTHRAERTLPERDARLLQLPQGECPP